MSDAMDYAGLVEKSSEWLGNVHTLLNRLRSRSRTEIFYPGSLAPELMRRSEELLEETVDQVRETNAAITDLTARLAEAERERSQMAQDWFAFCEMMGAQIDTHEAVAYELTSRATGAEAGGVK